MKKIAIVSQLTGMHGRGAVNTYHDLFRAAFPESTLISIDAKIEWNTLGHDSNLDNLARQIKQLGPKTILVFLGADWHSRVIHRNPDLRALIAGLPALKIAVYQESYLRKKAASALIKDMQACYRSAHSLFDIHIFNHFGDYLAAQSQHNSQSEPKRLLYLPFLNPVDSSALFTRGTSNSRLNKIIFVGDAPYYPGNPYIARKLVLEKALSHACFEWIKPQENQAQHIPHETYISTLCRYNFALIPPSIDSSLTVRQIEACSAGAIPLTPAPIFEIEQTIFQDGNNCLYYEPLSSLESIFARAVSLSEARIDEIRNNAIDTANKHTPVAIASTFRDFVQLSYSLDQYYGAITPLVLEKEISPRHQGARMIAIDLVFYQYADTGIAKVWESLLLFLSEDPIKDSIVLFVRKDSAYIPAIVRKFRSIVIPAYDANQKDQDSHLIDWACDQEGAAVFVSTYMTYSHSIHNVVMIHDCIPERVSKRSLHEPMWEAKKAAIANSDTILTISEYSANEILAFYPEVRGKDLFVTPNAVREVFFNNGYKSGAEADDLSSPDFCLLVGERTGYLGYKNGVLALQSLQYFNDHNVVDLDLRLVGGWRSDTHELSKYDLEAELLGSSSRLNILRSVVSDSELVELYRRAACLLYLSEDEGYGLPIYECLSSGGRVVVLNRPFNQNIAHPNLIRVDDDSPEGISKAIAQALAMKKSRSREGLVEDPLISASQTSGRQGQLVSEILQLIQSAEVDNSSDALLSANILTNMFASFSDLCQYLLSRHPANMRDAMSNAGSGYDFGYITSTYNSSDFFLGLIDDILQSNHVVGNDSERMLVEHIIIDSASPSDELATYRAIDKGEYCAYLYYRTPYRETLYAAWNRGIKLSRARYVSNANTDDRHSPYFANASSIFLDTREDVMLAYPDQMISLEPNTPYLDEASLRRWAWPRYSYAQILTGNHVGSTPVWRRSIHSKIGYFNSDFKCAGDWDFWLRIATKAGCLGLINLPLSSYLFNASGIEHGDPRQSLRECKQIQNLYATFGEYTISERDHENEKYNDSRGIEDMQYSGNVGSRLGLFVVEELNAHALSDIFAIGQLEPSTYIGVACILPPMCSILPALATFTSDKELLETVKLFSYADVYLHITASNMVCCQAAADSGLMEHLTRALSVTGSQPEEIGNFLLYRDIELDPSI